MNMPVSVRKLFVGGIIGVSVLLVLACNDADGEIQDSAISPMPTSDQVSNTAVIPTATPHKIITAAEIVSEQEKHFADLYEQTVQSVVFIRVGTTQGQGSGSGFVWDTDGHVVTNYHVIQGAKSVLVKFSNGREYTADVVAFDTRIAESIFGKYMGPDPSLWDQRFESVWCAPWCYRAIHREDRKAGPFGNQTVLGRPQIHENQRPIGGRGVHHLLVLRHHRNVRHPN